MKKYTLKKSIFQKETESPETRRFLVDYRNELNPAQYDAVTSVNGPYLIIAGAGTGKTRTIVYRVSYLVELGVRPESVLLLTFTRKAAQEMLRRASTLLDSRCEKVSGGTFHSFANMILRRYAPAVGFDPAFTILDQADAEDVVNLIRTRMKFDTHKRRFPKKQLLFSIFSRSVNTLESIEDIIKNDYPQYQSEIESVLNLHDRYTEYKRQYNLMDYDDLLIHFKSLLDKNEKTRREIAGRYSYIMVDEYQDTNRIQADIADLLASVHRNLMVVGDDSQSIYSFRGATVRNILDFPERYHDCKVITLEENYRSTQPILNVANEILKRGRE
jgi:DNA helicase II / ATP-dependent DNA helicase PcrA